MKKNVFMPGKRANAVASAAVAVAIGLSLSLPALADGDSYAVREVGAAVAADPDNAVRALHAGEAAQQRRWQAQWDELDPNTRALVNGQAPEADLMRERGNGARHVRQDIRRREMFERTLADDGSMRDPRGDVERLGRHPDELGQLQDRGERARIARGYPERSATDFAQGRAPEASPQRHRPDGARHARGTSHAGGRMGATATTASGTPRSGARGAGLAKGVAGGMVVGWAADTALGTHVPDPIDAAKWSADTLSRPERLPQRVGELANGAVRFTGDVATKLTRPDRMAVNLARGAVDVANTGAHMVTHPDQAVRMVGATAVGVGKSAVQIGAGAGRAAVDVAKAVSRPDKVVKKVGCGVGKLFKPKKKC